METKKTVIKIIASAILLAAAFITDRLTSFPVWADLLLYLPAYLVVGFGVLKECAENIVHGELLDEAFLMTVATVGALCIGFLPGAEPQFAEAVFVMLLFNVGELFEEIAEGRSRRSVMAIMELRPDVCDVLRDGKTVSVPCEEIAVGETVIVKPGERIAIDGLVLEGASTLDAAALTGESLPKSVSEGDSVASGCLNLSGVLKLKTTKPFGESTASKIIELVENASEKKSKSETMVKRFARVYTPAVVALAVLAAVVPPLISGDFAAAFPEWLKRALTFLIVSCPCALVISVPLTFFSGIGAAAKKGILIKGSEYVDALSRAETVVFDKTGTLTKGVFEVTAVHPEVCDEKSLLHLAAHVESFSTHPIALSLRQAYPESDDGCDVADVEETVGRGVKAKVNGETVLVGNDAFMDLYGVKWSKCHKAGTIIHVAENGEYLGHIVISDVTKEDAAAAVSGLKSAGVLKTVMLTGDRKEVAEAVAKEVGVDESRAELMPGGKVDEIEKLLAEKEKGSVVFVGDGINDAPVLARADVGVAMGAMGSDAAVEAADVVLMDDKPSGVGLAVKLSKRVIKIATENIVFSIAVKVAVLLLAAFGFAPMWLAVFADVGVTVLAILNAMRALKA